MDVAEDLVQNLDMALHDGSAWRLLHIWNELQNLMYWPNCMTGQNLLGWHDGFLCARYHGNFWADWNQMCMNISLSHAD